MKLLNANKAEVAFLDEGTTKLVYYGKDPALVYFTGATKDEGPDTCVVTKVASLAGYIETDAKNLVKIEGTLEEKIAILETVLGCKIGYVDPINGTNQLPGKTVKFYKSVDTSDTGTITIKVVINEDEENAKTLEFTRGPNAVTVKDVLKKLKNVLGDNKPTVYIKGDDDADDVILTKADKLLEDQTIYIDLIKNDEEGGEDNPEQPTLEWVNKFITDIHAGTAAYGNSSDAEPVDQTLNQSKVAIEQLIVDDGKAGQKVINLVADPAELTSWLSTNPGQQDAQHKWFALDFVFDADKLASGLVWGANTEITPDILDAPEGENTLTLWLSLDTLTADGRTIKVSDKNNPEDVEEITIYFNKNFD